MTKNIIDTFLHVESAAHTGAFGDNQQPLPTDAMTEAGNYKVGRVEIYGLNIAIEQPRHSYRTGIDKKTGKRWTNRLAAHYGYFSGTKSTDGDGVDCFIGFYPQSEYVYIINQYVGSNFDEFKVMIAFPDEHSARKTYIDSYDKGWKGLHSMIPASITQFKWWLKNGNMKKPLAPEHLPYDGLETMNRKRIYWDSTAQPEGISLDKLLYEIRRSDSGDNLLLDSVSMQDILEDVDSILAFDALVTPYAKLERKMNILKTVMERTGGTIKPLSVQISDPFKQGGTAQVAVVFELSDGQTVSIFFHNPDVTPGKIQPQDELISWKWLLNKKDITIVVAPEHGDDLNVHDVAMRIMKLAEKNSPAFQRANTNRAAKMQAIEDIKTEIVSLEAELTQVQHELEVAKVEAEDRTVNPKPSLQVRLENMANDFGPNRDGFYGVISDGQDLPDNFMPQDNRQMNMAMKEIAKESGGQSFAFQVNASKEKPFRVIKTMVDAGSEVGSDWSKTPEEAYNMLPQSPAQIDPVEPEVVDPVIEPEPTIKPLVNYSVKATFADTKANGTFGDQQTCYVEWKSGGKSLYGAFVAASDADKREFGLGVFRAGKGEFQQEVIAKIDPKGMKIYFVDNAHYLETDEVKWDAPVKLTKLLIFNKPLFEQAFVPLPDEEVKPKLSLAESIIAIVDGIGGLILTSGNEYARTVYQSDSSRRELLVSPANAEEIFVGTRFYAATGGGSEYVEQKYFGLDQVDEAIDFGKGLLTWVNGDNEQANQQTEVTAETEEAGAEGGDVDENQAHIDTLQAVVDGAHDSMDLNELLDVIDAAAQALIDAGVGEANDDLIGAAAEKWAALDEQKNG